MKQLLLFLTLFFIVFTSCKKEEVEPNTDDNEVNNSELVTAKAILVQTVDQNGVSLSGVEVELGGEIKTSDNLGVVQFSNIELPSERATIVSEKFGYFTNYQVINPISSDEISVVVTLAISTTSSISASAGGQVQSGNGAYIEFPANGFLDENGSLYTGNVTVASKYIDPAEGSNNDITPNSFNGKDQSGSEVFVENHGMILAELYDDFGNKLFVNPANPAELHIPLTQSDIGTAPNQISFYYFNEEVGRWIEDGQADLINNEYVGTVDHFTFWMCPYVYDHHSLSGNFECSGIFYSGAVLNVYNQFGHLLGAVTLNSVGGFSGSIPGTLTLTIEVEDPCGQALYSDVIGPFSSNSSLGTIDLCSGGTVNYGVVEGNLLDCSGDPDSDAFLSVQFNGISRYFPANSSGTFSEVIFFCNNTSEASIIGVNSSNQLSSQEVILPVNATMNFGSVQVCSTPDEYCSFTLDGENYYYLNNGATREFNADLNFSEPEFSWINIRDDELAGGLSTTYFHFGLRNFYPEVGTHMIPGYGHLGGFTFDDLAPYDNPAVYFIPLELTYVGTSVGDYVEGQIVGSHTFVDNNGGGTHTIGPAAFRIQIDEYIP